MGDVSGVFHAFWWLALLAAFFWIADWMVNKKGPM